MNTSPASSVKTITPLRTTQTSPSGDRQSESTAADKVGTALTSTSYRRRNRGELYMLHKTADIWRRGFDSLIGYGTPRTVESEKSYYNHLPAYYEDMKRYSHVVGCGDQSVADSLCLAIRLSTRGPPPTSPAGPSDSGSQPPHWPTLEDWKQRPTKPYLDRVYETANRVVLLDDYLSSTYESQASDIRTRYANMLATVAEDSAAAKMLRRKRGQALEDLSLDFDTEQETLKTLSSELSHNNELDMLDNLTSDVARMIKSKCDHALESLYWTEGGLEEQLSVLSRERELAEQRLTKRDEDCDAESSQHPEHRAHLMGLSLAIHKLQALTHDKKSQSETAVRQQGSRSATQLRDRRAVTSQELQDRQAQMAIELSLAGNLGTDVSVPPARGEAPSITVASRSDAATTGDSTLAVSSNLADKVKTSKRATKQQLYKVGGSCTKAFDSLLRSLDHQSDPLLFNSAPEIELLKRFEKFQLLSYPDSEGLSSAPWMASNPPTGRRESMKEWQARSTLAIFGRLRSTIDRFGQLQSYMSRRASAESEYLARMQKLQASWDEKKGALETVYQNYREGVAPGLQESVIRKLDIYSTQLEKERKSYRDKHNMEEDETHERNYSQMTKQMNTWADDLLHCAHGISQELVPQLPESVTLDTAPWLYEAHTAFQSMDVGGSKESDWAQAVPMVRHAYLNALEKTRHVSIDGDEGGTEDIAIARKDLVQQWFALVATQDMASVMQAGHSSNLETAREDETMPGRMTRSKTRKREALDSLGAPSKIPRQ